jgi:predicted esterase
MSTDLTDIVTKHRLATAGAPLDRAERVVISLHGRGATAVSILSLADELNVPDTTYLAPQARTGAWYPQSFIAPIAANEPHLSQAIAQVHGLLDALSAAGISDQRIALMGFSQGACLAVESALRRPRSYGAIVAFSGGYIGPLGPARRETARLDGATAFLGCSDIDSHIPLQRVNETTRLLREMGASVTERIYPGFGHAINADEIAHAQALLLAMR